MLLRLMSPSEVRATQVPIIRDKKDSLLMTQGEVGNVSSVGILMSLLHADNH